MNSPRSLLLPLIAIALICPAFAGGWSDDYKASLATAAADGTGAWGLATVCACAPGMSLTSVAAPAAALTAAPFRKPRRPTTCFLDRAI